MPESTKKAKYQLELFKVHGKDIIFYPWLCPGESFYITEQEKSEIRIFLKLIATIFIISIIGIHVVFYSNFIDNFQKAILLKLEFIIFSVWYVYHMYQLVKNKPNFKQEDSSFPTVIYIIAFGIVLEVTGISLSFYYLSELSSMFMGIQTVTGVGALIALLTLLTIGLRKNWHFVSRI